MTGPAHAIGTPLVKICGISDPETARITARAGADFIGLVFYPKSHRYVDEVQAGLVAEAAREASTNRDFRVVGLFVNESTDFINRIADSVGLDLIQISGDEAPNFLQQLNRPAIATLRGGDSESLTTALESWTTARPRPFAMMIDADVPGRYGGTGEMSDWEVAREVAKAYPTFLAGGLDANNVHSAIVAVQPFAVDVSTGVETNKQKDPSKILAFLDAARSVSISR